MKLGLQNFLSNLEFTENITLQKEKSLSLSFSYQSLTNKVYYQRHEPGSLQ